MKKTVIYIILAVSLLFSFSFRASAVGAYPYPFAVTQPDGSKLTIQMHGDEFLSWTTCGNQLVAKGPDGYYYQASFGSDGSIVRSSARVSNASMAFSSFGTISVRPPVSAISRAMQLREENARMAAPSASAISTGTKKFLVLLIEFADVHFASGTAKDDFNNMLNQTGYSVNSASGSVKDYFTQNSTNSGRTPAVQFDPVFDVFGPITVSQNLSYYSENKGYNTPGAKDLLFEACELANGEINFADYDLDGNGVVDNIFFYFAGYNMAEGNDGTIWPHQSSISSTTTFDAKKLGKYACSSEFRGTMENGVAGTMCGIGTFCHEFGHVIGLPDFYDVDYATGGQAYGVKYYSLMASGNYNNEGKTPPYLNYEERKLLGWIDDATVFSTSGDYSLETIDNNVAYVTPAANPDEYYLFESRKKAGWDAGIPGEGLLIYHVDKSQNIVNGRTAADRWKSWAGINAFAEHECMKIVRAQDSAHGENDPFSSATSTSFTSSSTPAAILWNGQPTGYNLSNIASTSTGSSFTLSIVTTISGIVTNTDGTPITGAEITITPDGSDPISLMSDSDGIFVWDEIASGIECSISITKEGYYGYGNTFTTAIGTTSLTITLRTLAESVGEVVRFCGEYGGYRLGYGSDKMNYAAIQLYDKNLVGYQITSISFHTTGTLGATFDAYVFVKSASADTPLYEKKVEGSAVNFGSITTVDVSDMNIIIPDSYIFIGIRIHNSNYAYPISMDGGPHVTGGQFIGTSYSNLSYNTSYDRNVMVYATVENFPGIFGAHKINTINSNVASYTVGNSFTFKMNIVGDTPVSTTWTYDGTAADDGSTITLTEGQHTVIATLTYSSGRVETIEKVLVVNAE